MPHCRTNLLRHGAILSSGSRLGPVARIFALVLVCTLTLSACGSSWSAGDAEEAISDQSHRRVTDPECINEVGEPTFQCSAANSNGHRIKVLVMFPNASEESSKAPLILVWPCVSGKDELEGDPQASCTPMRYAVGQVRREHGGRRVYPAPCTSVRSRRNDHRNSPTRPATHAQAVLPEAASLR